MRFISSLVAVAAFASFAGAVAQAQTVNLPPTISGTPATRITAKTTYNFRPAASDPEGGTLYIRETIRILDSLEISATDRADIYQHNAERLFKRTF